jgi:hypothetical protein
MRIASFDMGIKNFAFLIARVSNGDIEILEWENVNVNGNTWSDILQNVNSILYEYAPLLSTCDVCLVEKQMTRLNFKASRLSYHVLSFFNIMWPHVKSIEYQASKKTATFTHAKMDKRERKMYCIHKTLDTFIAKNQTGDLAKLLCVKKMDDLCDVYQMVESYLKTVVLYGRKPANLE